jgi:hypothetical protein
MEQQENDSYREVSSGIAMSESSTTMPERLTASLRYRPLNNDRRELRLLTLLHPDHGVCACDGSPSSDSVHVLMEHFSLQDYMYKADFNLDYGGFCTVMGGIIGYEFESLGPVSTLFTSHLTKRGWFSERGLDTSIEVLQLPNFGYEINNGGELGLSDEQPRSTLVLREQAGPLDEFNPSRHGRFAWGDFIALSYTWGDSTDTVPIVVNDCRVDVTRNLEAALRALRCRKEYRAGMKLWVDALCINQQDLDERAVQVARMSDIYPLAINVHIWIDGVADITNLHFANTLMAALPKQQRAVLPQVLESDTDLRWRFALAFWDLFSTPYWRRTWIVQELVSSPWWATFICGSESFTWNGLVDLYFVFRMSAKLMLEDLTTRYPNLQTDGELVIGIWKKTQDLIRIMTHAFYPGKDPTGGEQLERLLAISKYSLVSDDRDRVYGMLSILPPEIAEHIRPSYSLDVESVYIDFSRALIQSSYPLDTLFSHSLRHHYEEVPKVPTWAIDFRDIGDPSVATWLRAFSPYNGPVEPVRILQGQGIFQCQAIKVDVIDGVSFVAHDDADSYFHQPSTKQTSPYYKDDDSLKLAVLRSLYHDPTLASDSNQALWFDVPWFEGAQPDTSTMAELERHGWGDLIRHPTVAEFHEYRLSQRHWDLGGGRTFESLFPRSIAPWPGSFSSKSAWSGLQRLVTCASGRVGTTTLRIQHGDAVYIIPGCSLLVILRPDRGWQRLVGLVFVDGWMRGEVMGDLGTGKYTLEDIQIC